MKDTPEDVLERAWQEGHVDTVAMLTRYAAQIERLSGPVSDAQVVEARRAYSGRETIDSRDFACNSWMRDALNTYRKSLMGETE